MAAFTEALPALMSGLLAALLACGILLAWVRLSLWQRRAVDKRRGWRFFALLALQLLAAGLLYRTLLPPEIAGRAGTLVVATAGTGVVPAGARLVALPEAPALVDAERVPDLATALRRHSGTAALQILGAGLPTRDRPAAAGLALAFDAPVLPVGLIRLDRPAPVAPGAAFDVGGAVNGVAGGSVRLLDPAGEQVAAAALSPTGTFRLAGAARAAGTVEFTLQIRDADGDVRESVAVPVIARADPPPRVLVVAGAAGPDLKFLRRWATDAGLPLSTRIETGAGGSIGDGPARLDGAALAHFDLLVLDERSWAGLTAGERSALLAAVRGGLGLMLRVTGPVPDEVRRQWAALGLTLAAAVEPDNLRLPGIAQPLHGWRMLASPAAVPLLAGGDGGPLAAWRSLGQGRIGLWPIMDSYTLALAGNSDAYSALWSRLLTPLARPAAALPTIAGPALVGQRLALCGVAPGARVVAPGGVETGLIVDPATGSAACAAFWPHAAGWHALRSGDATLPFAVADHLPAGVIAREARDATRALVRQAAVSTPGAPLLRPGNSWPWFAAFLAVVAMLWWLERARRRDSNQARDASIRRNPDADGDPAD